MSEQILERSATGTGPIPGDAGVSGTPEAPESRRNRTFVVSALAVVVGLVLGGLVLFVLQPGSSEEALDPGLGAGADAAGTPGGTVADGSGASAAQGGDVAEPAPAPVKRARARLTSRDPFAPLIPKKPTPAPSVAPVPSVAPGGSAIPAPSTPATGGTISALSIAPSGTEVTLKLDGRKYSVEEGETFAKSYRLYDIFNDNCAGFLYGDRNAVVCEGDSVTIG